MYLIKMYVIIWDYLTKILGQILITRKSTDLVIYDRDVLH